jgi:hypothetical protein
VAFDWVQNPDNPLKQPTTHNGCSGYWFRTVRSLILHLLLLALQCACYFSRLSMSLIGNKILVGFQQPYPQVYAWLVLCGYIRILDGK